MQRFLLILLIALAFPARAFAGGPALMVGVTEDAVKQPTLVQAKAKMDILRLAGFNAVRVTQVWAPGQTEPTADDVAVLWTVVAAADPGRVAGRTPGPPP